MFICRYEPIKTFTYANFFSRTLFICSARIKLQNFHHIKPPFCEFIWLNYPVCDACVSIHSMWRASMFFKHCVQPHCRVWAISFLSPFTVFVLLINWYEITPSSFCVHRRNGPHQIHSLPCIFWVTLFFLLFFILLRSAAVLLCRRRTTTKAAEQTKLCDRFKYI